jgi:Aldehyde dehydrogenase family
MTTATAHTAGPRTAAAPQLLTYRWSSSDEADRVPVEDPATGEVIAVVRGGGPKEVDAAVEAARRAFETDWRWRTWAERATLLLRGADVLEEHADELAACAASTSTRRSHRVPPCPLSWHSPAPATSCSAPTSPTTTASPQHSQPRSTRPTASRPTTRPRSAMATPRPCSRACRTRRIGGHYTDGGFGGDGLPGTHIDSLERTA